MNKLAGAVGAACFALACTVAPLAAQAQTAITLQLDWTPYGIYAPAFLAAQKGWFKDAGLDVAIRDGKGSNTTIQLVAAGTVDVGWAALSSLPAAIDQGLAVTSVSGYIRAGDNGFIVPVDSTIHEPRDFVGKRIAFALGGGSSSLLDAFWQSVGLKPEQMTMVGVDLNALTSSYITGSVDVAVSPVGSLLPMVDSQRPSRAIPFAQFGLRVPGAGLIVKRDIITTQADMLHRLVPVLTRAWQYVADGHVDEGVDAIIAQRPNEKLDRPLMIAQMRENLKLIATPATAGKPIGWQSESDWHSALAALKVAGAVKSPGPATEYFTNQFIAQ